MAFAGFPVADEGVVLQWRSKRKGVDDVADDFAEFSLSAPARKMRRLDIDVPLIINQPEVTSPMIPEDVDIIQEQSDATATSVPSFTPSEEMAIVLYKPMSAPSISSSVSLMVDSNFIASIKNKNQSFWSDHSTRTTANGEEALGDDNKKTAADACLAIIPWLPSLTPEVDGATGRKNSSIEDQMDLGEEAEAMLMDVEEGAGQGVSEVPPTAGPASYVGMLPFGGLQQWQQQHCMHPNAPPNTSAAHVTWSW